MVFPQPFFSPVSGISAIAITGSNTITGTTNNVTGLGTHTHVFLLVMGYGSSAIQTVSSLTVEASAATFIAGQSSTGNARAEIWAIEQGTATPDIAITWSGTVENTRITAIGTTGVLSLTALDTAGSQSSPATLNVDTEIDGIVMGCGVNASGTTASWTGATESFDAGVGDRTMTSAFSLTTSTQSPRTVTITWGGGFGTTGVSASFR